MHVGRVGQAAASGSDGAARLPLSKSAATMCVRFVG